MTSIRQARSLFKVEGYADAASFGAKQPWIDGMMDRESSVESTEQGDH